MAFKISLAILQVKSFELLQILKLADFVKPVGVLKVQKKKR